MALHERVKTALDESRTLILGAQILLGFQYRGAFQERFAALPPHAHVMDACALGLMLLTVGLLITPSALHRIAARGEDTGQVQAITGRLSALALLPFAVALGLDLCIALERLSGSIRWGGLAGTAFGLLALLAWYGMGEAMKRHHGGAERARAKAEGGAREAAPLHARIEQMLTEARVILPGAQALLGFQLAIVLTSAFEQLPESSRLIHGAALLCTALAVILLIAPAALHRIVWKGEDSEELLRRGGLLTILSLVPVALAMAGDAYVVLGRVTGAPEVAAVLAGAVLAALGGLWFAWPLLARPAAATGSR